MDDSSDSSRDAVIPSGDEISSMSVDSGGNTEDEIVPSGNSSQMETDSASNSEDSSVVGITGFTCEELVRMALSTLNDENDGTGRDINGIYEFIKERHQVPEDFTREQVAHKVRQLVREDIIQQVGDRYRRPRQVPSEEASTNLARFIDTEVSSTEDRASTSEEEATASEDTSEEEATASEDTSEEEATESEETSEEEVTASEETPEEEAIASEETSETEATASEETPEEEAIASEETSETEATASEETPEEEAIATEATAEEEAIASEETPEEEAMASEVTPEAKATASEATLPEAKAKASEITLREAEATAKALVVSDVVDQEQDDACKAYETSLQFLKENELILDFATDLLAKCANGEEVYMWM